MHPDKNKAPGATEAFKGQSVLVFWKSKQKNNAVYLNADIVQLQKSEEDKFIVVFCF